MPVATPVLEIVAMVVSLLLQEPPVTEGTRVTEAPIHTESAPVMVGAVGKPLTVTKAVATEVPQALAIV
jgi:hypothetical protein